jgi:hypothetical protein
LQGSGYLDERTEQGMSGKENTLLPMPDPVPSTHWGLTIFKKMLQF